MAGGRSKHGYIDWGEIEERILLVKTYSFVNFDTRPHDFIVISDDLTTANMDPWHCTNIYFTNSTTRT